MKGATSIQERLWELRKDKGLNLEELSELTGISKSALGSYEKEDYRANGAGLSARCARPFFLSPKMHLKGRQLPADRELFKFSFALVIREIGFWQPVGQRIFPFTPYTTAF